MDEDLERRAEELLARMTREEKLGQLNAPLGVAVEHHPRTPPETVEDAERLVTGDFEEGLGPIGGFFGLCGSFTLGGDPETQLERHARLQRLARENTRLGIPLLQVAEGCHGLMAQGATVFPEGPALGSTWDPALISEVYAATAREASATGVHMLCTLVIEPIRDPRLGRNCEAYSEDPFFSQLIAHAIVAGVEGGDPAAPDHTGAILTAYPGQSEPVSGLERGAMEVSDRTMRCVFLPPWTAVSGPTGALGLMGTYAAIDGLPAHASEYWMTDVLRGELGFDGVVFSEGHGFETIQYEGVVETQKQAGVLGLRAGIDVNITYERAFLQPLLESLREGLIDEELLDRAVRRVLLMKFRLGLFDAPVDADPARLEVLRCEEHVDLALRTAREGIVLLRNEAGTLPLSRSLRRVAVIGPNADEGRNLLGDYVVGDVSQPVMTVRQAVLGKLAPGADVRYERGCDITDLDDADIDAAAAAAAAAEVAIVVVGERSGWFGEHEGRPPTIGEGADVPTLDLTGRQEELVRAVQATGTPTIVVLVNGRALSVAWAAEHVAAIVEAWLPGERGGEAIADVLFGDHNPSGRLPVTIPTHVGELPSYYNAKPSKAHWLEKRWIDSARRGVLYPFGYGLSYTTFEYGDLRIDRVDDGEVVAAVTARVRNTGDRAGSEVAQLYVGDRISSLATPLRELRGIAKLSLAAGEEAIARFDLTHADLALLDASGRLVVEPGVFDVLVGASCEDIRLRGELVLDAQTVLPGAIPLRRAEPARTPRGGR